MDTQHRTQPQSPMPTAADKLVYDGRYTGGWVLVGIGLVLALLSALLAVQEQMDTSSRVFSSDPANYSTAAAIGGIAGFVILLGVILVGGAQIIGTEPRPVRKPRR
jgi:uncharacterized integral membrane protein